MFDLTRKITDWAENVCLLPVANTLAYFVGNSTKVKQFYDFDCWLDQAIAETNEGYSNSKIPIVVKIHCVVNSDVADDSDLVSML